MSRKFALVLVALLVAVPLFAAGISSTAPGHKTDNSAVAPASQAPYHRATPKAWMTLHTQDFETAMAPWTHTNGQAFPNGWDRQNSALHSTWTPPAAGSWSLWIDSDAAGSGASQADTAMSPAVATPSMDTIKFVWGHSFNYYSAADLYQVLHRTFSTGAWSAWIVDRSYTADLTPVWDSVTITDEVDSIQLGFYYQGAYGWYTAVDNVTITGFQSILAHDVKTQSIDVPATAIVPPGVAFLATMSVKNAGTNPESDFGNNYVIYDSTGTQVYGVSAPIVTPDSLQPDSVRQIAISNFTPDSMMRYQVVAWPSLAGDERHSNDTMRFNFRTFDRDMGATAIVTPAGNFTPADDVDPQATFHNYATEAADFDAHFQIYDGTASLVYDQTVAIAGLAAGADTTITFPTWAAPHAAGTYSMMAYTVMTFDLDAGNDTATGSYNCAFMGWTALDPTGSNAIQWPGFCTDGSLMYIVGGISSSTLYNYVQVYDPVAGTWSQPTTMPTAAWRPNCAVIDGKLYVIGGMDAAFAPVALTQIYDIAGNSWSTGTVAPSPRGGCGGGVVGGRMYIVGGATSSSFPTDCPTWEYNPAADTAGGSPWPFNHLTPPDKRSGVGRGGDGAENSEKQ
ncbi:hypothetical protein EG831_03090, partial [bacterium]|nr:hypothetical protein [bacterium]